ncbi:hypothetical protein ACJRO7_010868 [Eucalyptus globulus]|uniref:Uncharacterized protein n=1 Tax=Eucalyptus globulus TaxID=34317 RepID=A0ABD3LDB7_EUCGL
MISLCSSLEIAGTETKLVYLSYVGHQNSLPDPIRLYVQNQKKDNVRYLLDCNAELRALMKHYCVCRGLPYGTV